MKIVDILVYPLYAEAKGAISGYLPYGDELSKKVRKGYSACFVKVVSDEGLFGYGESLTREVPQATAKIIEKLIKPIIIGKDPLEIEVLWEMIFSALKTRGHYKGYFIEAMSGVDIALWDLKGKYLKQPVHMLLGGKFRSELKAYASSILFDKPENMARRAREWVDEGHDQIKVKVGMGVERDIMNLRAIRREVGNGVEIMVDANSAYNFTKALRLGKVLESMEISWFEEPVPPYDLEGYKQLKRKLDVPICAGESHFTRYDFKELIMNEAIDIVQPDISRAGGITECMKIANLARTFNLPYTPHIGLSGAGCRAASIQLSASLPEDTFLTYEIYDIKESPNPLANEILHSPIEIFSKGHIKVVDEIGLGLKVNEERLKLYMVS
ncbi:MAG: mandelate racemase/muconate lactonizing enzyme family protein [Nitrososphaerota archaeon]|nr:mandelate racemase/muconate lactonizing enzyme family protein [Nitrososphaerales archaeon]MDW8045443.1 mandelate racemase/muconate lactonizing enzyme family protein [Nitrososphaerota archaeon]